MGSDLYIAEQYIINSSVLKHQCLLTEYIITRMFLKMNMLKDIMQANENNLPMMVSLNLPAKLI